MSRRRQDDRGARGEPVQLSAASAGALQGARFGAGGREAGRPLRGSGNAMIAAYGDPVAGKRYSGAGRRASLPSSHRRRLRLGGCMSPTPRAASLETPAQPRRGRGIQALAVRRRSRPAARRGPSGDLRRLPRGSGRPRVPCAFWRAFCGCPCRGVAAGAADGRSRTSMLAMTQAAASTRHAMQATSKAAERSILNGVAPRVLPPRATRWAPPEPM